MQIKKFFGTRTGAAALIVAAVALLSSAAALLFLYQPAEAQDQAKEIAGLTLTSPEPGKLVIAWDAASPAPQDHRVMWAKADEKFLSFRDENTDEAGNAYPTGTSHTVTGLPEGEEYKVRVRARYGSAKAGPFSDLATVMISSTPEPTPQPTSEPAEDPPAKPTGLGSVATHDEATLSWTDPDDDSITGYQVLRGVDADSLSVLVDDTGSATTSYTDSSVAAETTYAYAVRARNADGLSPQSDAVSVTTLAALPAKPTGMNHGASHFSVLLIWTDPNDDSITGYQFLRGPDADSLTVLADDTGSATSSYTDDSVDAETTYVYAVRARNAGGLGPQSDPVTVTTLTAPPPSEEPRIARAVAGANFTLNGQALDTTDTCDDDDISNIAAACTINIDTADVVFAVDGEVDSDDRLTVKTGRDKDNLTEHADQGDLRGTDQGVDLTFLPGRSLLRIWGDEDESPGGGEEHFFRVNLVPYWELNGEQLSKSDDCKSTTDRTASEITNDNCIVTQFGNTANIQFSNVIKAQFNAYVYVNTTTVVDAPEDSDLANPFALDLADGDNVIRVRIASKGGAHGALSYGSNSFYYKVTTTDVLVSNLGQIREGSTNLTATNPGVAQPFTTGAHPDGYAVTTVRPDMGAPAGAVPKVSIYSDVSGLPGSSEKVLTNPSTIPTTTEVIEFDADGFVLDPNTTYWIVFEKASGTGTISVDFTGQTADDAGGASNWSVGDQSATLSGGSWSLVTGITANLQLAVSGRQVTDDATLSDLALEDAGGNAIAIDPTFSVGTTAYSATVGNSVTRIKVTATKADTDASIEYLDENNAAITDADITTMNVFDFDLEVGENIIKVKVTKGTATKTYTLTVYRQATITLTASHTSIIKALHDVTFTLTRTDLTSEAADFNLLLTNAAGSNGLSTSPRVQPVRFEVGDSSVEFTVPNFWISSNQGGDIVATLEAEPKYDASAATATVEVVAPSGTLIELKLDQTSYEVEEGQTLMFNVVANVLDQIAAPDREVTLGVIVTESQTAKVNDDYTAIFENVTIPASSWSLVSNRYTASVPQTAVTEDDSLYERPMGEHEYFEIRIQAAGGAPGWVEHLGPSMGVDDYPVTITDNETLSIEAKLSSTGLTASDNLVIAEDAGNTVTLAVTATGTKTHTDPLALPTGVNLTITPNVPATRGAMETNDWTIDVKEIALDGTATITIVDDSDIELTERVTFEVGLTGDDQIESSSATLNIVDDDTTGPALVFATVDGLVLDLEYSTPLSTTSVPAAGDFTVKVDGTAVSLGLANPVSISGSTVTLRLAGSVVASNVVTVSYTAPTANPIQDMSNNPAPSFTDEPVTNNSPAIPNDAPTGMPTISGTAMEGRTLTASTSDIRDLDGLTNPGYTYQWIRVEGGSDVIINGETSIEYMLTVDDVGHTVRVRVSFTDDATIVHSLLSDPYPATGTILALPNNEPTGRPTISGTAEVGRTLTADATSIQDADGLTNRNFSYQWVRINGQTEDNITGAVSQQYVLTNDELGLKVKVEVRFVDDRNELEIVESFAYPSSGTIRAKPNRQPTGDPTLSGQYEVGHTLTASTSGIADLDGLTGVVYTYQWERLESGGYEDIEDAESRLYTLTSDDEGKRVRVKVTFDDDDGNRHSLTSDPTGAVQAQSSVPSDKVEVSLGKTAYTVREGDSVDIEITLATAPEELVRIPYGFNRNGETSIYDYSTMYRGATSVNDGLEMSHFYGLKLNHLVFAQRFGQCA